MEDPVKRKVVKVSGYNARSKSPVRPISRPASPSKGYATSLSPPLIRPRAQVNSSVPMARKVSGSSSITSTSKPKSPASHPPLPRAPSPFKNISARVNTGLGPSSVIKGRVTLRPPASASVPASPESRQRSLTAVASDASLANHIRRRSGSASLHRTFSSSALSTASRTAGNASPVGSSPSQSPNPDYTPSAHSNLRPVKVKAKVSGLAKSNAIESPASVAPSPSLPLFPSTRPTHTRARAPSISTSGLGTSAPPSPPTLAKQFYQATSAVSAVSPYRFATTRHSPPPAQPQYRPFLPNDDRFVNYSRPTGAKVDPTNIPLPPQSPPTSAVSFSSHSSLSFNTETSAESTHSFSTLGSRVNPHVLGHKRASSGHWTLEKPANGANLRVDVAVRRDSSEGDGTTDGDSEGPDHKVKAEAKSNRKIADLEITNRSLLSINASLETTKHKQAKEIRELRRKLRESRLILPPRAFQSVKSSLDHDDTASEDEGEDDADEDVREGAHDETYKRVKATIDSLIEAGKRALEETPESFLEGKSGAKVLHAEEVRMWRDSSGGLVERAPRADTLDLGPDDSMISSRAVSPSLVGIPDSDDSSEGEVGAMTSNILDPSLLGGPPPITITPSI